MIARLDVGLGVGAAVALGLVAVAAVLGREGGGEGALSDALEPLRRRRWERTWIRERPEYYAELVSRIAHPDAPLGDPRRATAWAAVVNLYEAMEGVREGDVESAILHPEVSLGDGRVDDEGLPAGVPAFAYLRDVIRAGRPREVLSDEERAALKEFMIAAAAYARFSAAAQSDAEDATVAVADVARIWGENEEYLRRKLAEALREDLDFAMRQLRYAQSQGWGGLEEQAEELRDEARRAIDLLQRRDRVRIDRYVDPGAA